MNSKRVLSVSRKYFEHFWSYRLLHNLNIQGFWVSVWVNLTAVMISCQNGNWEILELPRMPLPLHETAHHLKEYHFVLRDDVEKQSQVRGPGTYLTAKCSGWPFRRSVNNCNRGCNASRATRLRFCEAKFSMWSLARPN